MAVTRRCVCCGKEYEYCPNCAKASQPSWMVSFCSEKCKGLFNIVSAYKAKRIGKTEVSDYVKAHAINNGNYVGEIQKALEEVVGNNANNKSMNTTNGLSDDNYDYRSKRSKKRWHRF